MHGTSKDAHAKTGRGETSFDLKRAKRVCWRRDLFIWGPNMILRQAPRSGSIPEADGVQPGPAYASLSTSLHFGPS